MSFSLFFQLKLKHLFKSVVHLEIHRFLFSWSIIWSPGHILSCSLNWNCLPRPITWIVFESFQWWRAAPLFTMFSLLVLHFYNFVLEAFTFPEWMLGVVMKVYSFYVIEKPSEKFFFIPSYCTLEARKLFQRIKRRVEANWLAVNSSGHLYNSGITTLHPLCWHVFSFFKK